MLKPSIHLSSSEAGFHFQYTSDDVLYQIYGSRYDSVMAYRVQLTPLPIVIDAAGLPVPDSHVVEIAFPGGTIDTMVGRVNTIVGLGVAKIIVSKTTICGVPLC